MRHFGKSIRTRLLVGAAAGAITLSSGAAMAQARDPISIAPQSLTAALHEFGAQTSRQVMFTPELIAAKTSAGVSGATDEQQALAKLLAGTGLTFRREGDVYMIVQAGEGGSSPQAASAVEALVVTAQKREENIQDVPIAISAFSQEALEQQKIEGGFDLLKAIPNVTFSKNNFSSYNFSIRGVGTKAISATTDPGVAVAFNYSGLIQNRLFEQEYFDVERVEVLRGPQGTLYGRNATSGVINVISAKPDLNDFDGFLKGEVGNYDTKRVSAMVNVPLIEDVLAVRVAGALTSREGYDYNTITKHAINGRDLWSGRVTVGFEPTESIRANFIWERFEEDDDRSRTGKQLCRRDPGLTEINGVPLYDPTEDPSVTVKREALFSQGCLPVNLYDDAAFGTPNGLALPFVLGMLAIGGYCGPICTAAYAIGFDEEGRYQTLIRAEDPYGGLMQSRNLREIASVRDPVYRAKADVLELNVDVDITPFLTLTSQTVYNEDTVYSFQDFNRFNTEPIFFDTSQFTTIDTGTAFGVRDWRQLAPGGIFCDPQIGCTDRLAGFDISQANGKQFSQELRLQSDFDGPVNFSVGVNYTEFETLIDYYVMYNLITAFALMRPFYLPENGVIDYTTCPFSGWNAGFFNVFPGLGPVPAGDPMAGCPYIDPNPVESINGDGHNYFRSKNPYSLESHAAFGELYWNLTEDLKLTAGLRYTDDRKTFIPVPSQVLLAPGVQAGGAVSRGYPEKDPIKQQWGEWTGRLGLDWKPQLAFTDDSMLYAFYSRGYKGGGANPPTPGYATPEETREQMLASGMTEAEFLFAVNNGYVPILFLTGVEYGPTFDPEFVNAFELGSKNVLMNGALTFNMAAFLYDYEDYQVSQIRDRTAVNENFDAKVWGLEFETTFAPTRNLRIVANLGYLDTEVADGETSIDIMDRTQGNPDFVVTKPWVQMPSNCVVPAAVALSWAESNPRMSNYWGLCGGTGGVFNSNNVTIIDPETGQRYDPFYYDGSNGTVDINGGAGIRDELGGNELPNAPHWTVNIGAQYGWDFGDGWRATVRGDAYWQSQSWARIYNSDPYDKLHGWYNANLSVWVENEDGLKIELYAKNLLDDTPITDAFLNSDDTALTTNVFVLDPRLIGLSIRKEF